MSIEKILAAVGAAIAVLVGVFLKGRSDGKTDAKQQYDQAVANQRHAAAEKVKEVKHEVQKSTDDSVTEQLKSRWVRKQGRARGY